MTPVAAQLLLAIAPGDTLQNLFTTLGGLFPELRLERPGSARASGGIVFGPLRRRIRSDIGAGSGAQRADRWVSLSIQQLDRQRLLAHLSDVTPIVQSEMAAARDSSRAITGLSAALEHALEVAGMGTCSEDVATGRMDMSPRLLAMLGLDHEGGPFQVDKLVGAIHADDRAAFLQDRIAARAGTTGPMREFRCLRADGELGHVIGRQFAELDEQGQPSRVSAFYLDVSELRAADLQRRAVAEQLALATQAAGLGIFRKSRCGPDLVFDAQARRLLGDEQPDGPQPEQLVDTGLGAEGAARFRSWLTELQATDVAGSIEFEVERPGAPPLWLAARGRSQSSLQARSSIKGVIWDITEHRIAQQAIAAKQIADSSNRAKAVFLASMGHELRTPLNGILGICGLLRRQRADAEPATRERWMRLIEESGHHLLTLINDLLDRSRAEIGELKLHVESVDLGRAVEAVRSEQTESARILGIRVTEQWLTAPPAWVLADKTRLRQVLSNLLSNAIKYNRPNSSVLLQSEQREDWWSVRVIDSGVGISADRQASLCEPFNRLGQEGGAVEGIGLGLSITKQLVELMGGRLSFISERDLGSTFTVEFPAAGQPGSGPT